MFTCQSKLEFGNDGFSGEEETEVPGEKPLGAKERTSHKLKLQLALKQHRQHNEQETARPQVQLTPFHLFLSLT